jgi:hypothetical protein
MLTAAAALIDRSDFIRQNGRRFNVMKQTYPARQLTSVPV